MKNKLKEFRAYSKATGMIEIRMNRTVTLEFNKMSSWNIVPCVPDYKGPYLAGNAISKDFILIENTNIPDICKKDIHEGDIVIFTDFRGVHTTKSSKHDGYIPGWVGVIRWSDHDGWILDKNNTHNQSMLKAKDGEKQSRSNPYHYRMDHIPRVRPMIIGNMYENIDLLASFDYNAVKEKYESLLKPTK